MTTKKNAFDDISQLLEEKQVTQSNPAMVDIGGNNFFEIDFPTNPVDSGEEEVKPVTIDNDPKPLPTVENEEEGKSEDQDTEDSTVEVEIKEDQETFEDYTDFSLIALQQVKDGKWDLDEKDIPKDLDATTLMELFDAQEKSTYEKIQEDLYSKAGEYANYLKYLMEGGSPEVVSDALEIKKASMTDISTEEGQKEVITALLELKGLDEDLIEETLETIFDKGKGKQEAEKAINQLNKYEESILENKAKELENQKALQTQRYNEYVESVTNVVKKGKVNGIDVNERKQKLILDALFKPTETVEVPDKTGKLVKTKVTKSTKLFQEVNQNPEKLAALTLWLLEGGTFENLKEEVKAKKDDSLREILKGRKSVTVVNKPKPTTNAFEVLANRANNRI